MIARAHLVPAVVFALVSSAAACGGGDETSSSSSTAGGPGGTSSGGSSGSTTTGTPTTSSGGAGTDGGTSSGAPGPTPKSVSFIAVGDTGTGSTDQAKVGNTMAAICKQRGCDFIQLLGDNLYDSGASSPDDPIFQEKFEIPYTAVDLDFFVVLGNHDYGAGGAGTDFGKGKNEVEYTKKSKKWKLPSAYYKHTKEHVEFFGLDTNMQMFGQDKDQKSDVSAWIKASTATWKIAFGHHPYKSNGPHGNAGSYEGMSWIPITNGKGVKEFLEDHVCGSVDLYLSGHDHSRQWLNESCKGTELAVSGAGAKATELEGNNATLFQSLELGFLYIKIVDKTLTAEFIDENGVTEFTHVIKKP
jgi:tartrate-resistant acid phosphatase type 5